MSDRPGVMLYFDSLRPALKRLDDTQCGCLLRAVMDYAEYGVLPELDAMTGIVFDLLLPKIDRDAERYEESREQRQYAAYSREAKRKGEQPIGMSEWKLLHLSETTARNGSSRVVTGDAISSPSISPSASPYSSVSSSSSTSPVGTGEAEGCKGEGEGEHKRLFREWNSAMDEKDNTRACVLSNKLFALGYLVDPQTRELKRGR